MTVNLSIDMRVGAATSFTISDASYEREARHLDGEFRRTSLGKSGGGC